jgi:hypothetical protein
MAEGGPAIARGHAQVTVMAVPEELPDPADAASWIVAPRHRDVQGLTPREPEILVLLVEGLVQRPQNARAPRVVAPADGRARTLEHILRQDGTGSPTRTLAAVPAPSGRASTCPGGRL